MGNSSITGDESIMFADNASFDGTERGGKLTTNGQLWIGSTASPHVKKGSIISPLGSITIGYSSPNITIDLAGGGSAIDSIAVQTGTSPVVPTVAGLVTINGATVAAGTNPVRTDGTGVNTLAVEVQISQALAAADATKIGLANFDSSSFAVAATGFVTASTTGLIKTLTGNSGGAISPTANNINTLGTGSITIAGSGSTLTTQLTGLTNHSVQVGAGTATLTQLAVGTNGQVLIAATAADPAFATLTSTGGTIAFTLGANSLNLEVASSGFTWNNVSTTSATMAKENGYEANNAGLVTLTMPSVASSTFGDTIKIAGFGAGGWLIQCVATQLIHFGSSATSAAGSLASTNRYDAVELVCSSTTTEWFVRYAVGNLTVA